MFLQHQGNTPLATLERGKRAQNCVASFAPLSLASLCREMVSTRERARRSPTTDHSNPYIPPLMSSPTGRSLRRRKMRWRCGDCWWGWARLRSLLAKARLRRARAAPMPRMWADGASASLGLGVSCWLPTYWKTFLKKTGAKAMEMGTLSSFLMGVYFVLG